MLPVRGGQGVPSDHRDPGAVLGYYTQEAAMALAWWRKAELRAALDWTTRVRVVTHKITYSISAEPVCATEIHPAIEQ